MKIEQFGFNDVRLIEGEHIDTALNLSKEGISKPKDNPEAILLTNRRIIHLDGSGKKIKGVFASIRDIDGVELTMEKEGNTAFFWAGLAFVSSILLLFAIDHSVGRISAAMIVALIGIYLIIDQRTALGKRVLIFKAGSSQIRCTLQSNIVSSGIYTFINRLYQLKDESANYRRFAPR